MAIENLDEKAFGKIISDGTVIVDFWASWCGPCKALEPALHDVTSKYASIKVGKVDIMAEQKIAKENKISSIPCLVVFKDGKEIERVTGYKGKESLENLFKKYS